MITAVCTLVHQMAIKATKEALRARGLKVTNYSPSRASLMAKSMQSETGGATERAAETVERWRKEGLFGKRAQALGMFPGSLRPAQSVRIHPELRTLPASEANEHRGIQR